MNIALAAFTPGGLVLSERVRTALPQAVFTLFDKHKDSAREWVARVFGSADALIFIGAAGLAVRLIAGLVSAKDKDPAVLLLDEKGRYVIPLLSGHLGGANRLAADLAARLGAQAVITTATDLNGIFAIDEWSVGAGCVIDDISRIKSVSSALLAGERVGFTSDFPVEGALPPGFEPMPVFDPMEDALGAQAQRGRRQSDFESARPVNALGVYISLDAAKAPFPQTLKVLPRIAVLGVGCKKGTAPDAFERFALEFLQEHNISIKSLRGLASIDLKRAEPCLVSFAASYDLEFTTFTAMQLNELPGLFSASEFVKAHTGVDNVCERAAVAAGGARLLIGKTSRQGMTLALGVPDWQCKF